MNIKKCQKNSTNKDKVTGYISIGNRRSAGASIMYYVHDTGLQYYVTHSDKMQDCKTFFIWYSILFKPSFERIYAGTHQEPDWND